MGIIHVIAIDTWQQNNSLINDSEAWGQRQFQENALGVKRPFSELSESSGVFSEQLSEFEIPFSEWHPTT